MAKPKQQRSEITKANILKVAMKHFSERGFDAANTRDIADEAGASHSMIRYHFGTKEMLWKDAISDMFADFRQQLGFDGPNPPALLSKSDFKAFIRNYIYYCAANPAHSRIMITESIRGGDRLKWMVEELIKPVHGHYLSVLRHHISENNLPDAWLVSLMSMIITTCQMPFVLATEVNLTYGVDMLSTPAVEAHIDSVLALFFEQSAERQAPWPDIPFLDE